MCRREGVLKWTKYFQIEIPEQRRRWPIRQRVRAAFAASQRCDHPDGAGKLQLFVVEHAASSGQKLNDWLIWNRRSAFLPALGVPQAISPSGFGVEPAAPPATRARAVGDCHKKSPINAARTATTDHQAKSWKTKKLKCGQSAGNAFVWSGSNSPKTTSTPCRKSFHSRNRIVQDVAVTMRFGPSLLSPDLRS